MLKTVTASEEYILQDIDNGVCRLTLNRAAQYNALSEEMLSVFQQCLDDIAKDQTIKCVVIAAQGRAFCAGHDLKQMRASPNQKYYEDLFFKLCQGNAINCRIAGAGNSTGTRNSHGCRLPAGRKL